MRRALFSLAWLVLLTSPVLQAVELPVGGIEPFPRVSREQISGDHVFYTRSVCLRDPQAELVRLDGEYGSFWANPYMGGEATVRFSPSRWRRPGLLTFEAVGDGSRYQMGKAIVACRVTIDGKRRLLIEEGQLLDRTEGHGFIWSAWTQVVFKHRFDHRECDVLGLDRLSLPRTTIRRANPVRQLTCPYEQVNGRPLRLSRWRAGGCRSLGERENFVRDHYLRCRRNPGGRDCDSQWIEEPHAMKDVMRGSLAQTKRRLADAYIETGFDGSLHPDYFLKKRGQSDFCLPSSI
jgi:hypothetical protein